MSILFLVLSLILNFLISYGNANYVGRYWSESKVIGGGFRAYIISGYVMAIAGFTMVYAYLLLIISPIFLQIAKVDQDTILLFEKLASDLVYVFCVITVIPTGFHIWLRSLKNFWEKKTIANGLTAGWNTFAQLSNTIDAAREAPSAFKRVKDTLFDVKGKKKDRVMIIIVAILVVILAILGGYFTASYFMKKADREYDMFEDLKEKANATL